MNYIPIVLTFGKWKKPLKKLELIKSVQKFKKDFVPILSPHKVISSSLVRKLNDDINNQTMYLNKLNQKIGYILVTTLGFIFGGSLSSIYLGIKIPNYLMIKNLVVFLLPVFIMFIYITSCNKQRVQCFNKLAKFIQFQKKSDLYLRYEENLFANSDKKCTVLYNLLSHENEFEFVIVVCIIVISLLIV